MSKRLNIQPQFLTTTASDLLSGAAQPRTVVKGVSVANIDSSGAWDITLFKGASGGSTPGTQVLKDSVPAYTTRFYPLETVLESGDFLTGLASSSSKLVINIVADIEL